VKKILITGASSGIGAEAARLLAARGDQLVLSGRSASKLEAMGVGGALVAGDLTSPGFAESLIERAESDLGGIEVVVHCAGVGLIRPAAATTDAEFTRVMNVNTRATFLLARAACEAMAPRKSGQFLAVPGILGRAPMKGAAAYCASKYAVSGMLKCFAQEYARAGIRFTQFFFGGVDSPFWDNLGTSFQRDKMLPVAAAAAEIVRAIDLPSHAVLAEVVLQPESHQLV